MIRYCFLGRSLRRTSIGDDFSRIFQEKSDEDLNISSANWVRSNPREKLQKKCRKNFSRTTRRFRDNRI